MTSAALFAQDLEIKGFVFDNEYTPIISATVQVKIEESNKTAYTFSLADGSFTLLIANEDNLPALLIASSLGYKRDTILFNPKSFNEKGVDMNFSLIRDDYILDQVYIEVKKGVEIDHDTTTYQVQNYFSIGDNNLESILKKLPGMEVKEDGTVFFKGKAISKVLLDGDDLTGQGYKVLTKNLKPEYVKEIQTIENFVDDILLKGIINSDDIVLNLKMKNPKNLFGNIEARIGNDERFDAGTNLVSYLNKTKVFASFAGNNIGKPHKNLLSLLNTEGQLPTSNKIIQHGVYASNPFDPNRFIVNESKLLSINTIRILNEKLKVKGNFHWLNDQLFGNTAIDQTYFAPSSIVIKDQIINSSKEQHVLGNVAADYLLTEKSRLWIKFNYDRRPDLYNSDARSILGIDKEDSVGQRQKDLHKNLNATLKYTSKLKNNLANIIHASYIKETIHQGYLAQSSLYDSFLSTGTNELQQLVKLANDQYSAESDLFYKKGFNFINLGLHYHFQQTLLHSQLLAGEQEQFLSLGELFSNHTKYQRQQVSLKANYTYDDKNIQIQAALNASLKDQKLLENHNQHYFLEPKLSFKWKATELQSLLATYQFKKNEPSPFAYYRNPILTDYRNITIGLDQYESFDAHQALLTYQYHDLINQFISISFSINANMSKNGIINNLHFADGLFYYQRIIYKGLKSGSGSFNFQKFFPFMNVNWTLNYTIAARKYFSMLQDHLRQFAGENHQVTVKADTGFDIPVNFGTQFQFLSEKTNSGDKAIASYNAFKYSIEARWRMNASLYSITTMDWYNVHRNQYPIAKAEVRYEPKNSNFQFNISGANLLNYKTLDAFRVNDFSSTKLSSSIQGRHILLGISYSIK